MAAKLEKTRHTGIYRAHRTTCHGRRNCGCPYLAQVWDNRAKVPIRKQFAQESEARSWRADAQEAVRAGTLKPPTRTTLREAWEAWLDGARAGTVLNRSRRPYKPSTLRGYQRGMDLRILPQLGDVRFSEVTRTVVQDLADSWLAHDMASSTMLNTLDPLRALCGRAVKRGDVAINPTSNLELPHPDGRRERIASPEEAAKLLDALPRDERPLWATAFYGGLRRGELRALRFRDIDLAAGVIHVRHGWDAKEGEIEVKSKAGRRRVPVPAVLRDYLAEHRAVSAERLAASAALVFGRTAAQAFEPSTVRRRALAAWTRGGLDLKPITLHEARHTYASLMIAAGVNAHALKTFMGHASITVTIDLYGHMLPGGEEEAAGLLNDFLDRQRELPEQRARSAAGDNLVLVRTPEERSGAVESG
jgi:integrase